MKDPETATKFKNEVLAVVLRYGRESDLTVFELLGALDVVKDKLIRMLEEAQT